MPGFRVNRKKFGLTWSCPVDLDENPISDLETIQLFLEGKGRCDYLISLEKHQNGKNHFHAYCKYDHAIDSIDERLFDLCSVHPNILAPTGKGWENYVAKHGDFISNYYSRNPWSVALQCATPKEAVDHLWETVPAEMCKHAHLIEANLAKRMRVALEPVRYPGPYPQTWYPKDLWDPTTHSLLLTGPPGIGKTQFARYLLGDCDYVKGTLENLRKCRFDKSILFDEIHMLGPNVDPEQSKEITDVENGGTIQMRHKDVSIPPGVPRIFVSNFERPFRDPSQAVYGRRVVTLKIGESGY